MLPPFHTTAKLSCCPMRSMRLPCRAHGAMAVAAMALAKGTKGTKGRSEEAVLRKNWGAEFSKTWLSIYIQYDVI